jgi:UDP-glucose 4-epimerase
MPTRPPRRDGRPPTTDTGAAVIGAGGFVGSRLVSALAAGGVPTASFTRLRPFLDGDGLARQVREARVIFYLATSVNPGIAERYPDRVAADHDTFRELLERLRRDDSGPTVVFAGSGTVYDPQADPPYSEFAPTRAGSGYGEGKLRMERTLLSYVDAVRPVMLRLASMYGPGGRARPGFGVIPHWLGALARGEPVELIGDPRVCRDFVYVDDVVEAMLRIHSVVVSGDPDRADRLPTVLNLGSGVATSLADLLREVSAVTGIEPVVRRRAGRRFDRRALWLDVRLAAQTLGWRPRTSLAEGLAHAWQAIREG